MWHACVLNDVLVFLKYMLRIKGIKPLVYGVQVPYHLTLFIVGWIQIILGIRIYFLRLSLSDLVNL